MIKIYKITKLEDLDKILPLIEEFRKVDGFLKNYTLSGIYGNMITSFYTPSYSVWTAEENNAIIGVAIANIVYRYFNKECHIELAYMRSNNPVVSETVWEYIQDWAKENECNRITCFSERFGMMRKYKLKIKTNYMMGEAE